ncbi:tetratricopeptide repeat protein [Candidatus Curtissbacteria bacterium]|nr:tetratricopeptide repeat protein [Candidatus Curtissbacteria bacterium]
MIRVLKEPKYQILIIVILTFGVYFNSLFNQFVWDDHLFVENWPQVRSFDNLGEVLGGSAPEAQGKIYRPIRGVIYMIDWQLFGPSAPGYRIQAVLLHVSVTVLVYLIAYSLISSYSLKTNGRISVNSRMEANGERMKANEQMGRLLPLVVGLLYGIHPIHTETIDYISASLETFGSLFFFAAFYLYVLSRGSWGIKGSWGSKGLYYWGSVGLAVLAFFTYEMTVTLPILLVLYDICFRRNIDAHQRHKSKFSIFNFQFSINYLPYFIGAVVFVVVRTMILGLVSRTDYLGYSFYHTMVTMVKVFVRYVGLLILPLNQTAIHNLVEEFPSSMTPYDKLDPILSQTIFDLPVILSIVTIALLILIGVKVVRLYPFITFGIIWFFIALLPVSYIIPHGGAMAEKYLYIASFGFILAAAVTITQISADLKLISADFVKQAFIYLGVGLVLFYGVSTIARNRVWHDDISLFSDVVKKSPNNLLANYTLGIWYVNIRNFEAGKKHYLRAIEKAPEFWEARFNLANSYIRSDEFAKAEDEYKAILNIYPSHASAKNILANLALLKESSPSAQPAGDLAVYYKLKSGLKFSFPAYWSVSTTEKSGTKNAELADVVLKDADETLTVEIEDAKRYSGEIEDFIKGQRDELGTLVNQGLAQIPNVQTAFVKVWSFDSAQDQEREEVTKDKEQNKDTSEVSSLALSELVLSEAEGVEGGSSEVDSSERFIKLQFFLFGEGKVVEIVAWPVPQGESAVIRQFDGILASIKIE